MLFNEQENKIIFLDIDDTLADTRRAVYDLYVELTGDNSGDINVKSKRYVDFCPLWSDKDIEKLFNSYTLYERVKPMFGAKEVMSKLVEKGYDLRIATIHVANGVPVKQKWIETHFPELKDKVYYVNCVDNNKDVFREYGLVDDDMKNIKTNKSSTPVLLDIYNIYDEVEVKNKAKRWIDVLTKY